METRLERYRQKRKQNFIKIIKLFIIACMCAGFAFLLTKVNDTVIELNVLENTKLFDVDFINKSITLLGDTYKINVKR